MQITYKLGLFRCFTGNQGQMALGVFQVYQSRETNTLKRTWDNSLTIPTRPTTLFLEAHFQHYAISGRSPKGLGGYTT